MAKLTDHDGTTIIVGEGAVGASDTELREAREGAERAFEAIVGALKTHRIHPVDAMNGMLNLIHALAWHIDRSVAAGLSDSMARLHAAMIAKHSDA